jgi:hypothetical protein
MIATEGGGPSFGSQAGEAESIADWDLFDAQERRKEAKQTAVNKVKRLLARQGKDAPLWCEAGE